MGFRSGCARCASFISGRFISLIAFGAALGVFLLPVAAPAPAYATTASGGAFTWLAGYGGQTTGVPSPPLSVSVTFRVPVPSCTEKSLVGFGALDNGVAATVRETCVRAKHGHWVPVYAALIYANNADTVLNATVSPDDLITITESVTPAETAATFTDNSTGFTQTLAGAGGTPEFAELGSVSEPYTKNNVPMFPTVTFTNAQVNGAALANYKLFGEVVQTKRISKRTIGPIQIQPGPLVGASSFQVNWVS
jgi:hypothetical protein